MNREFTKSGDQSTGHSYSGQSGQVLDLATAQQALMDQFASTAHLGSIMSHVAEQLDASRKSTFEEREAQAEQRHLQLMATFKDFNDSMLILFESFGDFNKGISQLVAEMRATRGMIDLHNHRLKVLQDQGLGAAEIAEDFPLVAPPKIAILEHLPPAAPQPVEPPAPPVKVKQKRQWSSPEARERVRQAAIATQARRRAEREQRLAEQMDSERRAEME